MTPIAAKTAGLISLLKPGGSLIVVEILPPKTAWGNTERIVAAHGFTEAALRDNFREAGLTDIETVPAGEAEVAGKLLEFFAIKGVKPA
jgi:hypothetical protein